MINWLFSDNNGYFNLCINFVFPPQCKITYYSKLNMDIIVFDGINEFFTISASIWVAAAYLNRLIIGDMIDLKFWICLEQY